MRQREEGEGFAAEGKAHGAWKSEGTQMSYSVGLGHGHGPIRSGQEDHIHLFCFNLKAMRGH